MSKEVKNFGVEAVGERAQQRGDQPDGIPVGSLLNQGILPLGKLGDRAMGLFKDYDEQTGEVIPALTSAVQEDGTVEDGGVVVIFDIEHSPPEPLQKVGEYALHGGMVTFTRATGL